MADSGGVTVLPEHSCWALLRFAEVARLAVAVNAQPDIFPINYVVDHGTIVFRTARGSKLSAASSHLVAFEVDGYDAETNQAWSVVIKGRAEEIKQLHQRIESAELPLFPWHADPKVHFVRIVPENISGRRFPVVDSTAWETPTTGVARQAPE